MELTIMAAHEAFGSPAMMGSTDQGDWMYAWRVPNDHVTPQSSWLVYVGESGPLFVRTDVTDGTPDTEWDTVEAAARALVA